MAYIKQNWSDATWREGQKNLQDQLNHMEDGIANAGGGGGEPAAYIKDAAVVNEKLTLTKKDDSTVDLDISVKANQTALNTEIDQRTSQYSQLDTRINAKQDKLTAGTNISISADNVISATAEDSIFKVTFSVVPGDSSNYDKYVADKTIAEIVAAAKTKKVVGYFPVGTTAVMQLDFASATEEFVTFSCTWHQPVEANRDTSPVSSAILFGRHSGTEDSWEALSHELIETEKFYEEINNKQDKLTAGANITINNNVISAEAGKLDLEGTSGTLTAAQLAVLANKSVAILRDNKLHTFHSSISGSSGEIRTYSLIIDNNTCPIYHYILVNMLTGVWNAYQSQLQDKLTAGTNITIDEVSHTISAASGTTVVANPTLAGTEAELNGLQVGDTKYAIPASRNFPSTWPIDGTCQAFLEAVGADSTATVGRTYQGGVEFSDLDDDLGLYNAEAEVEIISSTLSTGYKVIRLNVYSATNEPYSWARIYWWRGTASSSTMKPWQITARAADQYTKPYYTGTCNKTTGAISLSGSLGKGVYLVNIYGTQSSSQISYTYYFAYGGYQDWMTYSTDSNGTSVSALTGALTMSRVDGQALTWDADATVEIYKMR